MPGWVDTPEEEAAFKKAKAIVRDQRGKSEDDFSDRDWGLVTHIAQNILQSKVLSASSDTGLIYKLAKVERALEVRAAKKSKDAKLPEDAKLLVGALKKVMSQGGQAIAKLRSVQESGMDESAAKALASELEAVADSLKKLLDGLN